MKLEQAYKRTTLILSFILELKAELKYRKGTKSNQPAKRKRFQKLQTFNAYGLDDLAFTKFPAQLIHQPQLHLTGHIYLFVLNMGIYRFSDARNCFFFKARPYLWEHNCYISVKGRSCMLKSSITGKTGNLEALSIPVALLFITAK